MYVFTDLDGTLYDNTGKLSENTINYLIHNPDVVTIACSGRGLSEMDQRLKMICPYIICSNGALVYNTRQDDFIYKQTVVGSLVEMVETKLSSIRHVLSLLVPKAVVSHVSVLEYFRWREDKRAYEDCKSNRILFDDLSRIQQYLNDVTKIHVNFWSYQDKLKAMDLLKDGNYFLTSSDPLNLEITNPEASKKNGTQWLMHQLNISKKDVFCFGDADNDIPLFEAGGTNVAMVNATDHLKTLADYITAYTNDEDGVIRFLESYINHNSSIDGKP